MRLPLFPLHTVLFPGGLLPLKIFEHRYMDMAKECLRDESPFVVCAIESGREVGAPAVPARMGCTARIIEWDMPQLGVLQVLTRGAQRARITQHQANAAGLLTGEVELLDDPNFQAISEEFSPLIKYGQALEEYTDGRLKPTPEQLANATWLSARLSELLPLPLALKQQLLEIDDANARLSLLHDVIQRANEGGAEK